MGNNQPGGINKRERPTEFSGGQITPGRHRTLSGNPNALSSAEDGCPVQVKIAKSDDYAITPTVEFKESNEYPVVFKWQCSATSQPRAVFICGSWDGWNHRIPLVKSTSDFSTILDLTPGTHEYKFMVDGKWVVDDNQPKTNNPLGSENNVVLIDEADFEVFDALDRDLASSNAGEAMRGVTTAAPSHDTPNDRELEKLRTFTQDIPDKKEFEKAHNPPVLPPHLLQVILNKDTPVQCDPNVLPEPNHVMLNHLYALSIKDGVMVLSATHRYGMDQWTKVLDKPVNGKKDEYSNSFHVFDVSIKKLIDGTKVTVSVHVQPMTSGDSTAALVDLKLVIGTKEFLIEKDLWCATESVCTVTADWKDDDRIHLLASLIEILSVVDLTRETPYRSFCVSSQSGTAKYYIDPLKLVSVECELFKGWKAAQETGQNSAIVHELEAEDLKCLLEACLKHEGVVVHRRNYRRLVEIASALKIPTLLRAVESFIMHDTQMHPVRKLEYGLEFRMARLYSAAQKELGPPLQAFDKLHEYLRDNENSLNDLHPALFATFNITDKTICLT